MRRALAPSLCFVAASLLSAPALACSYASAGGFEVVADPSDQTPPATPEVRAGKIKRGSVPDEDSEGCGAPGDSCEDLGYVDIEVSGIDPNAGLVLEFEGPNVEEFENQFSGPVSALSDGSTGGSVRLVWIDGKGEHKIDFEVLVWSIDHAGNKSENPARLRVRHSGDSGCSTHRSHAGWLAALCALLLVRRPRRSTLSM